MNINSAEYINDYTKIHLFGKLFQGLKLASKQGKEAPRLARIYSFSYDGNYYKLPKPIIYLVWGEGKLPCSESSAGNPEFTETDTGLEAKNWRFASDIKVWKVDRKDKSMVIDLEVGKFEDILLNAFDAYNAELPSSRATMTNRATVASRATMTNRATMTSRATMVGSHQD